MLGAMSTRSTDALICECGHTGLLKSRESDQPYGADWVRHELEGFSGTVRAWQLNEVRCPNCGQTGKVIYADRT